MCAYYFISWAAIIESDSDFDAKAKAIWLMNDPDEWLFHATVERVDDIEP